MKVIATYILSNQGGIAIYAIDGDSVTFSYYDNEPETSEIEYNNDDEAYFKCGQIEIPLSGCMRTNR